MTRFWLALESVPGTAAVEAEWRHCLRSDFDCAESFLVPCRELADSYPRLDGRRHTPYSVVRHGDDDYVGVCEEDGTRVVLRPADLVVYEVDRPRLMKAVAAAFGFDLDGSPLPGVFSTHRLGLYRPVAGYGFPVFLTIQFEPSNYRQAVDSIAAQQSGPFILLAPTNRFHRMASESIIQTKGACFLSLADALAPDQNGNWSATAAGERLLDGFRTSVLPGDPGEEPLAFFPTPANATWVDVRIRFVDGHTISVKACGVVRTLNYTQMGMADGRSTRPTVQWELLRSFAQGYGVLLWDSPAASRKNQKRRENLARDLRRFFRIEGEPIALTEDGKGWRTVFAVEPDA